MESRKHNHVVSLLCGFLCRNYNRAKPMQPLPQNTPIVHVWRFAGRGLPDALPSMSRNSAMTPGTQWCLFRNKKFFRYPSCKKRKTMILLGLSIPCWFPGKDLGAIPLCFPTIPFRFHPPGPFPLIPKYRVLLELEFRRPLVKGNQKEWLELRMWE